MACDDDCCCNESCNCEDGEENLEEDEEEFDGDEEREIDVLEFTLDEDEIDELIVKLIELKETKKPLLFEIDEDNEMIINYGEDSEEEE